MLIVAVTATQSASPPLDEAIARLAARQHGVVSRAQLRALGLSGGGISARVARGALHRRHQGAYAGTAAIQCPRDPTTVAPTASPSPRDAPSSTSPPP